MADEPPLHPAIRGKLTARAQEAGIAALAAEQYGVVSRRQLLARGFSPGAIDWRLGQRRLEAVHRGVYTVGHPLLSRRGRWMAAVLAGGASAVLSHRSASRLLELRRPAGDRPEITVRGRGTRKPGIRVHESAVRPDERTSRDRIPVTTVARTLLDLASVLDRERLGQAIAQAEQRGLADSPSLPELMERYPRRRGVRTLRELLSAGRLGLDVARSDLEIDFVAFLRRRGLPFPELNVWLQIGGRWLEVDCLWRSAGLIAELDSRAHHDSTTAFEDDRTRDRATTAAGLRTVRITWRQLHLEPNALESDLRSALAATSRHFTPLFGAN